MNNFEHIKSMNLEEMARFFEEKNMVCEKGIPCSKDIPCSKCSNDKYFSCTTCEDYKQWLETEI